MNMRIVVVGGVAAGMSAATRARRMNEQASIIVLERGQYVSFANCGLPYYLGGTIQSEDKLLVATPAMLRKRFNIDARTRHEVTRIDRSAKTVSGVNLATGEAFTLPYDKLILAPGAAPIVPPIADIDASNVFLLRSMEDTLLVKRWMEENSPAHATIIGAGFVGLEMAENLRHRRMGVTLVEKAPHVLPQLDGELAPYIEKELRRHEVQLITGSGLAALHASERRVSRVELEDGQKIPTQMVLLSIGVRPNVKLAQEAGLRIGASGAIAVDEFQRTSDPDIYAAGDAAEVIHAVTGKPVRIPLAGPANRNGRIAGEHAASGSSPKSGAVPGTAIVAVFGLSAAVTGLGESAASAAGFDADAAYVHPLHHAGYYPGAHQMHLKLIYDRRDGRVLGAQAVGAQGVDKRIDAVATLIHFKGTIDDLSALDLAYAPQFGSAKDPLHMAAFVAQNQRRGITKAVSPGPVGDDLLLDVRTPAEFAAGTLEGAINIPVDELRSRLGELDCNRDITLFCQVGLRGYVAQRILQQNGFRKVKNIKGGFLLAGHMMPVRQQKQPPPL